MRRLVVRGYITEEVILALPSLFYVPKGTDDIRMVFDATVSGISNYVWAPNLMFQSMGSLNMMMVPEMHMVDLYAEEKFYNFRNSSVLAKYCGVDLGSYLLHKKVHQGTHLWVRLLWRPCIIG